MTASGGTVNKPWYLKWWALLIGAILVIGIIVAIVQQATSTAPQAAPAEATTPSAEAEDDACLTPTVGAIRKLQDSITTTVPGATFSKVGVAASPESDITFIAITLDDGSSEYTGVWGTMQDPTTEDDIAYIAVDEIAEVSAEYLQPTEFDGKGIALPGAKAALACLR